MNSLICGNMLEEMRRVFNADEVHLFSAKQNDVNPRFYPLLLNCVENNYKKQYEQDYWQFDPFMKEAIGSNKSTLGCSYNIPRDRWFNLQYYKEFLRPQNLDYELAVYVRMNKKLIGAMDIFRSRVRQPFDEKDLARAKLLLPYINQTLHDYFLLREQVTSVNKYKQVMKIQIKEYLFSILI